MLWTRQDKKQMDVKFNNCNIIYLFIYAVKIRMKIIMVINFIPHPLKYIERMGDKAIL